MKLTVQVEIEVATKRDGLKALDAIALGLVQYGYPGVEIVPLELGGERVDDDLDPLFS